MMDVPLLVSPMLERAERLFPEKRVVSRMGTGVVRHTYREIGERARRLSSALERLGVKTGDRVGTLAWNHHRHLEAYFAVPSMGAVLHTINIRLSPEHLVYIINHAADKVLLVDADLLPLVEAIQHQLKTVEAFVIMFDQENWPDTDLSPAYSYEELLAEGDPGVVYPKHLDENAPAGMCYTSATTG